MKTTLLMISALVALTAAPVAVAQSTLADTYRPLPPNGGSSVLTGRTVGAGNLVVHPEVGYPGASIALLWGRTATNDTGVRLSLGYAPRVGFGLEPTVGAQAVVRWAFLNQGMVSLGGRIEPGALVNVAPNGGALLIAPFGLDLGIHPHPIINIAIGGEVGVGAYLDYRGAAAVVIPVQVGPGIELNLTDRLQLTFDTRFGTGYSAPWPGYRGYGLRAAVGLAVRT